jgi:8-oxo-dGTP diphosphatase
MIRRYGDSVHRGQRYQHRPGVYAVLRCQGQILTTVQFGEQVEVQLPGGGIDPGEAPISALHREVLEETGWKMALERKLGVFRRFTFMPEYGLWAEKLCHIYLGRPTLQMGPPLEPDHIPLWMPLGEAVAEMANSGDRAFVEAFVAAGKLR